MIRIFFHLSMQPPFLTRSFHIVSAQRIFIERISSWRGTELGRHYRTWGTECPWQTFPSFGLSFPICAQCAPDLKLHYSIVLKGIAFRATKCQAVPMATTGFIGPDLQHFNPIAPGTRRLRRPSLLPEGTQRQIIWSVFSVFANSSSPGLFLRSREI